MTRRIPEVLFISFKSLQDHGPNLTYHDSTVHQDGDSKDLGEFVGDAAVMMHGVRSPIKVTIDISQNGYKEQQDSGVNRHQPKSDPLPPLWGNSDQGNKKGQLRKARCVQSNEQSSWCPCDQSRKLFHVELGGRGSQPKLR